MLHDFKYAVRSLGKNRTLLAIAISTLAIGIGANTAVFSALNSLLIRPLPYAAPERLLIIGEVNARHGARTGVPPVVLQHWRAHARSFDGLAGFLDNQVFPLPGNFQSLRGARVSHDFFDVLGVRAALGRTFVAGDAHTGAPKVAVISDTFWRQQWSADPSVLGQTIEMAHDNWTIVGVLPPNFRMLYSGASVWVPLTPPAITENSDGALCVIGRLRTAETAARGSAELTLLAKAVERPLGAIPDSEWRVWAKPLREYMIGNRRALAVILQLTVGLVLLTACLNLATLLVARATARSRETVIRLSLGASRWHLLRQSLAEAVVISFAGGGAGLLLTIWIREIAIATVPELRDLIIDGNVLLFTGGVSLLTAFIMASGPALAVKQSSIRSAQYHRSHLRCGFVVAQTALAVALLVAAGVLLRSLTTLQATDPGFRSAGILVAELSLPETAAYGSGAGRAGFVRTLLDRTAADPMVRLGAAATAMPLFGAARANFEIEGRGAPEAVPVAYRSVSEDYFRLYDVPLQRGRHFSAADHARAARAVIINDRAAAAFWPMSDPLGQRIRFGKQDWATVVGIAAGIRSLGLRQPPIPEVFAPYDQEPTRDVSIALRTDADPLALIPRLTDELRRIDRDVAITYSNSMPALLEEQFVLVRALSSFSTGFAAFALLLAATGLYGVVSYLYEQRTREIGIRVALGATRTDILRIVATSSAKLAAWGLVAGNAAGFLLAKLFSSVLFGVGGADVAVFAGVTVILAAVEFAATFTPALRAAAVDPAVALRSE